jgi:hypothetical protein
MMIIGTGSDLVCGLRGVALDRSNAPNARAVSVAACSRTDIQHSVRWRLSSSRRGLGQRRTGLVS